MNSVKTEILEYLKKLQKNKSVKYQIADNSHIIYLTDITSNLEDEVISALQNKMMIELYELIWTNVYETLSNELSKN